MKYYISDPHLEILMKKYGDPIPNEINYVVILNDAKEFGENKDIHKDVEFLASQHIIAMSAFSPVLTITNWVSRNTDEFEGIINHFNRCATDENYSEDIRNAFNRIAEKLQEIRNCIEVTN